MLVLGGSPSCEQGALPGRADGGVMFAIRARGDMLSLLNEKGTCAGGTIAI